jgi:hypothetical protein
MIMKQRHVVMQLLTGVLLSVAILTVSIQARSDTLSYSDQRIYIHYVSTLDNSVRQQITMWLKRVADALLTVYGELPKDKFNITI